jgi:hypothetical protein
VAGHTETTRVCGHFPDSPGQLEACHKPPLPPAGKAVFAGALMFTHGTVENHRHAITIINTCLKELPSL